MATSNPIISIVTPTYNRSDELDYLIESISNQTLESIFFEMVISDDGSTDDTKQMIKRWIQTINFSKVIDPQIQFLSEN